MMDHSAEKVARQVAALAWRSAAAGSIGVGAILVDRDGGVICQGRNTVSEPRNGTGKLSGSAIAHAEMNLLSGLPVGRWEHATLWSSLEPCPMCSLAILMSNIAEVRYLGRDFLWHGKTDLAVGHPFLAERWPDMQHTEQGPLTTFSEVLPLLWFLREKPEGTVVRDLSAHDPERLALAKTTLAVFADEGVFNADFVAAYSRFVALLR